MHTPSVTPRHADPRRPLLPFVAAGLIALSTPLDAQRVSVGFKTGASRSTQVSTISGRHESPWGNRVEPTAAVTASLGVRGPVAVQVEAMYARRGWTLAPSELRLDYVEVPVMLRIAPSVRRGIIPVLLLGVAPSFEVACGGRRQPPELLSTVPPGPLTRPIDCDTERQRRRDLGLVGAIGVDLPLQTMVVTTELRYTGGARDLTPAYAGYEQRNRSFAILVGLRTTR